jgi:L,D-transpeptidase catalytic domain
MYKFLNQLMRIALLLTAIDAALVLFPLTAHAGSNFHRAIGAAGAKKIAVLVNIDKTNQQMTVSLNGVETYQWPVSTGRAGYSTPSGTYTATSMNKIWYSKQWDNSPMPHSIFFMKDGHAIHGSFEVKNLGKPVSHGCVRISPKNAATLYALVEENGLENTQVVVTGVSPGGEYNVAEDEPSPPEEYNIEDEPSPRREHKVARGQTSPRGVRRSSGVPYYNGSQGYSGSPWPWTYLPHW